MKRMLAFIIVWLLFCANIYGIDEAAEIEENGQSVTEVLNILSAAEEKLLKIGLVDCISYALKNNSEIRMIKIKPLLAQQDISIARADFDPTLDFEGSLEDDKVENASILVGSHSRTAKFNLEIDGKLPLGTEYELDFLNKKYNKTLTNRLTNIVRYDELLL